MQKTQVPYLALLSSVFSVVKVNQLGAFQHLFLKEKALASSTSAKKKKQKKKHATRYT